MGNNQSAIDPVHLRIYSNIVQIRDPLKRVQMINTCLSSMEYVGSAKRAGIYSYLLNYIGTVNSGGSPPLLPGEQSILHNSSQQQQQQYQQQQQDNRLDQQDLQTRLGAADTQRYRVSWSETRNGEQVTDSLSVDAANADAAMDSVRSALTAQRRRITNIEAEPVQARPNVNQQADRLIAQYAAQRAQGEFTGRWQIRNANTNEVLHTFGGIGNSQADANRVAQRWAQQSRIDDPLEVTPEMR